MKCYVWEDVFCDYTCGLLVVCADSLEEALEIVKNERCCVMTEIEMTKPKIMKKGDIYYVFGGA